MKKPTALLGRKIIVTSVMPPKSLIKFKGILKRPYNLSFSWKSKKRKGALCEAYIDEKITGETKGNEYLLPLDKFLEFLSLRFQGTYQINYEIIYENTKVIIGKKLIGECSTYHHTYQQKQTHRHGGNITEMSCERSVLCYNDIRFIEDFLYVPY